MPDFSDKLSKALLENVESVPEPKKFLEFLNAIVVSADQQKVDQALEKAAALSPQQLFALISQSTFVGGLDGLKNALQTMPNRLPICIKIAQRLYPRNWQGILQEYLSKPSPSRDDEDEDDEDEVEYHSDGDYYVSTERGC